MSIKQRIKAPIHEARLRPLSSHQRVAEQAVANCMDGWPVAGSWEEKATIEGRWIEGDPAYFARRDSAEQAAYNFDGLGGVTFGGDAVSFRQDALQLGPTTICSDFACAVYPDAPARRADSRPSVHIAPSMTERVAAAAVTVVRRLSALARALPGMGPAERARAEEEIAASSAALQAAGVEVV